MFQANNGDHSDMIHGRFIGDDEIKADESDKNITVLFSVKEEVGALSKCLKIFEVSSSPYCSQFLRDESNLKSVVLYLTTND